MIKSHAGPDPASIPHTTFAGRPREIIDLFHRGVCPYEEKEITACRANLARKGRKIFHPYKSTIKRISKSTFFPSLLSFRVFVNFTKKMLYNLYYVNSQSIQSPLSIFPNMVFQASQLLAGFVNAFNFSPISAFSTAPANIVLRKAATDIQQEVKPLSKHRPN